MKKLLLSVLAAAGLMSAQAAAVFPVDYEKFFTSDNLNELAGWTIYAPEGQPVNSLKQWFSNYSPSNAVQILYGNEYGAWSVSEYTNGQESDTWLITPEFEVKNEQTILAFTVQVFGMARTVTNKYYVYVSEGGTAKEDFTLYNEGTITGSSGGAENINLSSKRITLDNYKGKKIRLAFVNAGNTKGMMGFGGIQVANWYSDGYPAAETFDNKLIEKGSTYSMNFPIRISTPVTAAGFTVDFKTSGGFTYSLLNDSRSLRLNSVANLTVSVPDITMTSESETYTLTITPNFEGAAPAVITGSLTQATREFEPVGVMEEATGTWCGWCPYGAAALLYYGKEYNGENGTPKAIGIAIHGDDPMQIPEDISDYFFQWMTHGSNGGYPAIAVNRIETLTPSPNPTIVGNMLDEVFGQKAFAEAKVTKVNYLPSESNEVTVHYAITPAFETTDAKVNVSIVLTEDDVQGTNIQYNQTSYVSMNGDTAASITNRLGEEWLPYFEPYFNKSQVTYNNIQYPHVARGAFPSYAGLEVPVVKAGETYESLIRFEMPKTVMIEENTNVVVILTHASSGEILAADELSYDNFTFSSGVGEISDSGNEITASLENGTLRVVTDEAAMVNVYGIDGSLLLSANGEAGENVYSLDNSNKVVIVTVNTKGGNKTLKLINK